MLKRTTSFLLLLISLSLVSCNSVKNSSENIYTGTVECESYNISSEVSGKLSELNVSEGSTIKAGDKVAKVDSKVYEIQQFQAEGALKIAEAKQSDIPSNAKASIKDEAQGAVDQAKASVDLAKLQVSKSSITSPIDGTVTDVLVHKGDLISTGTNILKISDIKSKYLKIYIEESKRSKVKLNQSLTIKINNATEKAQVVYISTQSEFTPKNVETKNDKEKTLFEVKLKLKDNSGAVPGLMADVSLE
ncbi:biotin/lipoyl-binding protein [Clostridium sp. C8-1-8]|uniref:efflux RND transporter periplasmic adaptor subunit n=1 Tax=Clostridium sp. C8-1-8 TaxID=2698831 RepID=UPI001370F357|nr:biotin/lipoyl-binding protein [Clostridium sp. C8-1-8]